MRKIISLAIASGLMFSASANAWWGGNWGGWNPWPAWTPMYWMEEMSDIWDDDYYGPWGYGGPYGYHPYGYAPYGYGGYAPYGYGYAPYRYGYAPHAGYYNIQAPATESSAK